MKKTLCIWTALLCALFAFAGDEEASLTVTNVKAGAGTVFVAIYDSEDHLKQDKAFRKIALDATGPTLSAQVSLPPGDYYVAVFQDMNGNGTLDTKIFGIPKEPVGLSNYEGKGIPGGFNKHKTRMDGSTPMTIALQDL